jgi:hypothetical protein
MKITIPNPCSEDWQTMTATEKGQFCAVCQKCVVDFTTMTDAEIIRYLDGQKGKTCGRFTKEQLNRPLTPPNRFKMPFAKWVLASTFSLSFLLPKEGFAAVPMVQTQKTFVSFQEIVTSQNIDDKTITDSLFIKGIVLDSVRKEGLYGATIIIKDTQIGTQTDYDGRFEFSVPKAYQNKDITLTITFITYETKDVLIQQEKAHEKLEILLTEILSEPIYLGMPCSLKPTLWQRTKRLFRKKYH